MLNTIWGVVKGGKVEPLEKVSLPEDARALITILPASDDSNFWLGVSQPALAEIWDNPQDDVYGKLLEE
jgi:hypothetical protein